MRKGHQNPLTPATAGSLLATERGFELETTSCPSVERLWNQSITLPWSDFSARPRKNFRGEVLRAAYLCAAHAEELSPAAEESIALLDEVLEALHAGSLVIDDIEDGSHERRGSATLHVRYGLPVALNFGNYLYFRAFEILRGWNVPCDIKLRVYEAVHRTLYEGHRGQALDVTADMAEIPMADAETLCWKVLEAKSGALMRLAFTLGSLAAEAERNRVTGSHADRDEERIGSLSDFGTHFGIGLQMFDDVGNLRIDRPTKKSLEDLVLRRPSWVWTVLAREAAGDDWDHFKAALHDLPDVDPLGRFLKRTKLREKALHGAREHIDTRLGHLRGAGPWSVTGLTLIENLTERLMRAYE